MGLVRGLVRGIVGLAVLGVGLLILVPVGLTIAAISIPVLIVLALAGVVGAGALLSVGLPLVIVSVLAVVAIGAIIALIGGAITLGVLALKVMLFGMLLLWLARKLFGGRVQRVPSQQLVGLPVVDVAAPMPIRDKYDIAAERELDEELGL